MPSQRTATERLTPTAASRPGTAGRFLALPGAERRLRLGALGVVLGVRLALWCVPLAVLHRRLARLASYERDRADRGRGHARPRANHAGRAATQAGPTADPAGPGRQPPGPIEVERVARAVRSAAHRVPAATCLTQALAAQYLLARRGYRARIHVGFARVEGGEVVGHAWVDLEDRVILGAEGHDLSGFTTLTVLEAWT